MTKLYLHQIDIAIQLSHDNKTFFTETVLSEHEHIEFYSTHPNSVVHDHTSKEIPEAFQEYMKSLFYLHDNQKYEINGYQYEPIPTES